MRILTKKEDFLNRYHVIASGEEEMLAHYLHNINEDGKHDFVVPSVNGTKTNIVHYPEGEYAARLTDLQYLAKKEEDRVSYRWDLLIEHFYHSFYGDERVNEATFAGYEAALRKMTILGRTERRGVGRLLSDIYNNTPLGKQRLSTYFAEGQPETAFLFLLVPWNTDRSQDWYTELREMLIGCACNILRMKHPNLKEAVAIGLQPLEAEHNISETLGYCDFSNWNEEIERQAIEDQKLIGYFTREVRHEGSEREYPDIETFGRISGEFHLANAGVSSPPLQW